MSTSNVNNSGLSPISFSGLASGVNTSSIVSQLVALESAGLNRMQDKQTTLKTEQSAYTTLGQKLQTLEAAAAVLSHSSTYDAVAATSSVPNAMAATASAGALQMSYNVTILNRSTASRLTSGAAISSGSGIAMNVALNGASGLGTALTSSTGSFTVNGKTINYDASTDTMTQLLARINTSGAGVNAMYDKLADKIILTNRVNGASPVSVADVTGNLASALNLTNTAVSVAGQDAQIKIDGLNNDQPIHSQDDIFTEAETGITGLTINVNQDSGNSLVTVGTDKTAITSQFTTFINAYNDVQNYIAQQTAVTNQTSGPLAGDMSVKSLESQMRKLLNTTVNGLPSGLNYLAGLGVGTTSKSPNISIFDASKLSSQLSNNIDSIKTLLTDPTTGIMTQFDHFIQTQAINPTGLIHNATDSITKQNSRLTAAINQEQNRINAYQAQLQASFSAMEATVSTYQGGLNQLLTALGQSTSNSNSK